MVSQYTLGATKATGSAGAPQFRSQGGSQSFRNHRDLYWAGSNGVVQNGVSRRSQITWRTNGRSPEFAAVAEPRVAAAQADGAISGKETGELR